VKKLVISVDNLEDSGDEAPSVSTDLVASVFATRNMANALVTEFVAVWATFIQFQDTLAGSLDRLTDRGMGESSCGPGFASTTRMGSRGSALKADGDRSGDGGR
jgi:hypothetical protein